MNRRKLVVAGVALLATASFTNAKADESSKAQETAATIYVDIEVKDSRAESQALKLQVQDSWPATVTLRPDRSKTAFRYTVRAQALSPEQLPVAAKGARMTKPIKLELRVDESFDNQPWIIQSENALIVASGSTAALTTRNATGGSLEIIAFAREVSASERWISK